MALYGAFDSTKHLDELNDPLVTNEGVKTPATRKAAVRTAIGFDTQVAALLEAGVSNARFSEQPLVTQGDPAAVNATATMTAANLLAGIITSTTAAAVNATLPLATDFETSLVAAYPSLGVNDSIEFVVINTGGTNTFTVVTNTGWTLVGSMAVAANSAVAFRARRTAANTYTLYRVS